MKSKAGVLLAMAMLVATLTVTQSCGGTKKTGMKVNSSGKMNPPKKRAGNY